MTADSAEIHASSAQTELIERNRSLRALIGRAALGDVASFEALYHATARWMLSRVRRMVGESLAEDVMADTYLQVWRSLGSYTSERGEPTAWLMTIARTRALDRLRRERVSHGGLTDAPDPDGLVEQSHTQGPHELMEMSQQRAAVHHCLSVLAPKERMVLALSYFGDCTQREIAAQTGLPLGSVKTLMTRGQQKLRLVFVPIGAPAPYIGLPRAAVGLVQAS